MNREECKDGGGGVVGVVVYKRHRGNVEFGGENRAVKFRDGRNPRLVTVDPTAALTYHSGVNWL